ncbi:MAG: PKD domain-containing protein, partial [Algicola sp.]|nr:PKD domain-containing protein [Algicola sp.]
QLLRYCRPYKGGNNEEVVVDAESLQDGRWYVMVRAYSDYSGLSLSAAYQTDIAPENVAPTAGISYQSQGLAVSYTDTSTDSDGSVVNWAWDFGDGNTSTEQNPSHTYTADGSYTVALTVTDDDGATNATSQVVAVEAGSTGGGASYSNEQPLVIDDNNWLGVKSSIAVDRTGDSGLVTTSVKIVHDDAAQLLIKLRAPDGTKWYVSNYEAGNVADGIEKTLTFDASNIDSEGTWKLYLYDRTSGVEGYLDNWSITFPSAQ